MLTKLKNITTFVFDVDGVFTDGMILSTESGEQLRSFNIKDGYALQLAIRKGYHVCIISGGKGQAMEKRFSGLGVKNLHLGVGNKVEVLHRFTEAYQLNLDHVLYMGDDIPDLEAMKLAGLACCPKDAAEDIKAVAHYISPYKGGKTAVRDVIEKVLRVQGQWFDESPMASDAAK